MVINVQRLSNNGIWLSMLKYYLLSNGLRLSMYKGYHIKWIKFINVHWCKCYLSNVFWLSILKYYLFLDYDLKYAILRTKEILRICSILFIWNGYALDLIFPSQIQLFTLKSWKTVFLETKYWDWDICFHDWRSNDYSALYNRIFR